AKGLYSAPCSQAVQALRLLGSGAHGQDAFRIQVAEAPVGAFQAVDTDAAALAAGGMDEAVITHVNAGVTDAAAATVIEEDHIARFQLVALHPRSIQADHFAG